MPVLETLAFTGQHPAAAAAKFATEYAKISLLELSLYPSFTAFPLDAKSDSESMTAAMLKEENSISVIISMSGIYGLKLKIGNPLSMSGSSFTPYLSTLKTSVDTTATIIIMTDIGTFGMNFFPSMITTIVDTPKSAETGLNK